MLRIVVGGFGRIARLGIREILAAPDLVIVGECGLDAVMATIGTARPDVLLLDTGPSGDCARIALVAAAHPEITIVGCSAESIGLCICPRFGGGRSFCRPLSATALVASVRS